MQQEIKIYVSVNRYKQKFNVVSKASNNDVDYVTYSCTTASINAFDMALTAH